MEVISKLFALKVKKDHTQSDSTENLFRAPTRKDTWTTPQNHQASAP
ncbi:hypothetical protein LPE509_00994 [Legionella pneumophila subsp. pneumophila LPE509]|nr:hypothetical protein LPE509_00994 [Legionella pneumophila subsp. pneumophila LPE509]